MSQRPRSLFSSAAAPAHKVTLLLPLAVLLVGLVCSLALAAFVWRQQQEDLRGEFELLVARIADAAHGRLNNTSVALRGSMRPLASSGDAADFALQATRLVNSGDYPGLKALALARVTAHHTPPGSVFAQPQFELVWSAPVASVAAPGTPLVGDAALVGALDQAVLGGQATLLPLPQLGQAQLLLAMYRTGAAADTESQRLQQASGMLVATIDIAQAMAGVVAAAEGRIDFELFDGAGTNRSHLLYDDDGHLGTQAARGEQAEQSEADVAGRRFVELQQLRLGGRVLTLRASTTPLFDQRHGSGALPAGVLAAGSVLALLAALLVRLLAQGREHGRALARTMTLDLERLSAAQQASLQSLARQQAHLRAVISSARCGVLSWHVPNGEVTLDDGLAQLLGYEPDTLRPMTPARWAALTHPADLPQAQAVTRELILGQRAVAEHDVRMQHRSGRWLWTQVRASVAERDASGRTVHVSAIFLDIDERKLSDQRWQLRATLASDWYWQTDVEHRVEDVDGGLAPGVLAVPAEYRGKRRDQISWFDAPEGGWVAFHEMLDRHEAFKGVAYRSHSTGGDRWVEIDGQPRFDDDGTFLGYAGVGREITDRRRVTEQLRESLAMLDALLASLPIPVIMKDRQRRFQRVNPAYERQLGGRAAAVLGRRIIDFADVSPEVAARHDAADRQVIASAVPVHYEVRQRRPDGRQIDLLIYKAPVIASDGGVIGLVSTSVEITELRHTERALERERARLADIIAGANAGIVEWDLVQGTLQVDERYAQMLGSTPAVLQGLTREEWEERLHPEDRAPFNEAVLAHTEGRSPVVALDARLRHQQGYWVWLHIRGRVTLRDDEGHALRFTGANFDVTERHIASGRWQARAELSGDWFWQTNTEHRFLDMVAGPSFRALARGPDVRGRRRDELSWIDPPEQGWAAFHAMLDRQEPFKGVVYLNHTFAEDPRWVEIDGRPRLDESGRFLGYDGVGRDVTERRRVTEQLRQSLAQLDSLIRAVPIPLVMKDREGRNTRVNDAYCAFYGVTEAQVLGRTVFDFWEPEVAARYHAEDQALMADRRTRRTPVQVWTNTRKALDVLVHKSPIVAPDGEVIGTVGAVVDMSEQRAAARALLDAKEAAESANRAKSAFLATMSHEIRTPMNGVIGMAELLAHTPLAEDQGRQVQTIVESARSLLDILDDILDFSKIEAGRLELENQPLDPAALVESASDALSPLALAAGVALHVHVDAALPRQLLGDATRLRQIVTNLLGNAIKFSTRPQGDAGRPAGGRVTLRLLREAGDGGAANHALMLQVSDNGIGMDEMTLARLFVPFSQGEVSTTRRFGGTGLGLAIIHRLVEVMHGTVEVRSTSGQGSSFSVRLPLRPAPVLAADEATGAAPSLTPSPSLPSLAGLNCLLDPDLRGQGDPGDSLLAQRAEDLAVWLRDAGATVTWTEGGSAAPASGAVLRLSRVLQEPGEATSPGESGEINDTAVGRLQIGEARGGEVRLLAPTVARIDQPRRASLLRAVAVVAGRASPSQLAIAPPAVELRAGRVATTGAPTAQAPLILVAEDDATNRLVIERQLELLGLRVELAHDGTEAFEHWRRAGANHHAALLTDLHMPGMDGYTLAQTIRRHEVASGQPRMPILALTANALKGEALRARAAGIDDYLTKPVALQLLRATLLHWLPLSPAAAGPSAESEPTAADMPAAPSDSAAPPAALWNPAVPRTLIGDDAAGVAELVHDFLAMADDHAEAIRSALEHHDDARAVAVAHRLRSAARAVGAELLADECEALERRRTQRDSAPLATQLARFETVFADTRRALLAALAQPVS